MNTSQSKRYYALDIHVQFASPDDAEALRQAAHEEGRTIGSYARHALLQYTRYRRRPRPRAAPLPSSYSIQRPSETKTNEQVETA